MSGGRSFAGRVVAISRTAVICGLIAAGCAGGGPPAASSSVPGTPLVTSRASPTPPPATPPPTASPSPTEKSGNPWPSMGPAPTANSVASIYLSFAVWGDVGAAVESLLVFNDGRVVKEDQGSLHQPLLTRQMNETGLAFVRAEIAKVGLFDRSQTRKVVHSPNCCGGGGRIAIVTGGQTVQVGEATLPTGSYTSSAAWDRFEELSAHLADPDPWIPSTDWAGAAWAPFKPSNFCLMLRRDYRLEPAPLEGTELAWPLGVRPFASFGTSVVPGQDPDDRLGIITATDAYRLAGSIADRSTAASVPPEDSSAVTLDDGGWLLSPWIHDPDGGNPVQVEMWAASPGLITCPVRF